MFITTFIYPAVFICGYKPQSGTGNSWFPGSAGSLLYGLLDCTVLSFLDVSFDVVSGTSHQHRRGMCSVVGCICAVGATDGLNCSVVSFGDVKYISSSFVAYSDFRKEFINVSRNILIKIIKRTKFEECF